MGISLGQLVSKREMELMGSLCVRGDSTVKDKHDLRVSVSTVSFVPPLLIYVLTFLLSWRHIKHEYLHHNHKPRIDYLAWVLNVKLGPTYIQHLDLRITNLVRSRGLAAWRQSFRSEWRRCQSAKITLPLNPRYNPLPYKWVCTCPAFVHSRWLICKHLVQLVDRVPEKFFAEVNRERRSPIWRHPSLRPSNPPGDGDLPQLMPPSAPLSSAIGVEMDQVQAGEVGGEDDQQDGDAEEDLIDEETEDEGHAAERAERVIAMNSVAQKLHELADQIRYNAPYADQRVYDVVIRKVTPAIQLRDKICDKENTTNSSTGTRLSTWSKTFAEIMTWRTRPLDRVRQALNLYRGDS
jgi:hypothetical protein